MSKFYYNDTNNDDSDEYITTTNKSQTKIKQTTESIEESELEHLYETLNKMDRDIRSLWDNVMIPYINNYTTKQILTKLNENDYYKFHEYMVKNNDIYGYVLFRINELTN
ncbi:hypothetical protein QKU48_gp0569 [Fadolivirus algeromassiliense]|jgi:hypothetical protein|uniref:Uncharacterized protein n=1 Tax=Fadolivirus FV1/VV64 TaxID=3070911 RepID=A0A7D3QUC7_9VIRU|nr:hypothetical protein QKU48_gp0569 [Fadolivirus algeromassiliense]QKF94027.1 hypothetical protein Fadolivirus_1_569 [Fadolivirus FV1/VV64]